MAFSSYEDLGMPGEMVPFSIGPILLELDGGSYVGPILLGALAELFIRRLRGGSGDVSGGSGGGSGR